MEWIKDMSKEIKRLERKVKIGKKLTFSEKYFVYTVGLLEKIKWK